MAEPYGSPLQAPTAAASRASPAPGIGGSAGKTRDGLDSGEVANAANARRRASDAEPWQTILPVAEHLALVEQAGWTVTATQWLPVAAAEVTHGRRSLLATAEPLAPE